jgi:hypothetical protein
MRASLLDVRTPLRALAGASSSLRSKGLDRRLHSACGMRISSGSSSSLSLD